MLKKYLTKIQLEELNALENTNVRRNYKEILIKELIIVFLKENLEKLNKIECSDTMEEVK